MRTAEEWATIIVEGALLTSNKMRSIADLTIIVRQIQKEAVKTTEERHKTYGQKEQ